ncbi:MAG: uracil-xanthine permease [Clostridia bacterium]|nr:uracil-xanthine permease [Clostridia bacterium]
MKLIYGIHDKPKFGSVLIFAFQQLLAIMAATIAVPAIVGNGMSASAALFGAGVGTLVYQLFTRFRSPVFLGSSFAFLGSMFAAFAGAATAALGYAGLIIGAGLAGLVYVILAIVVKFVGVKWIGKLMPAVVIGPTVAIIGLSLAGNAVGDMMKGDFARGGIATASPYVALICALVTLFVVIICSTYGGKKLRLIPFIIGILAGYAVAFIFTLVGRAGNEAFRIIDFAPIKNLVKDGVKFSTFLSLPEFSFLKAFKDGGFKSLNLAYIGTIAVGYIPVAFVVFAEHIADHKNLSTIVGQDLLTDPGLSRTLLGDGIGSFVGAIFGGCPNTTYGESIGCVAITGNASVISITGAALLAILFSFISPFVAFLDSIPSCVMGGVCMTLYGFIAVSGLKMLQPVDLNENRNLFVVSVILIAGVGGLALNFALKNGQTITVTSIACALILGIITNFMLSGKKKTDDEDEPQQLIK